MQRFVSSGAGALLAATLAAAAVAAPAVGAGGHHHPQGGGGGGDQGSGLPYQNARLPVQRRVDDLLSRMNLAEKVGQMTQAERAEVDSPANTPKITNDNLG